MSTLLRKFVFFMFTFMLNYTSLLFGVPPNDTMIKRIMISTIITLAVFGIFYMVGIKYEGYVSEYSGVSVSDGSKYKKINKLDKCGYSKSDPVNNELTYLNVGSIGSV